MTDTKPGPSIADQAMAQRVLTAYAEARFDAAAAAFKSTRGNTDAWRELQAAMAVWQQVHQLGTAAVAAFDEATLGTMGDCIVRHACAGMSIAEVLRGGPPARG